MLKLSAISIAVTLPLVFGVLLKTEPHPERCDGVVGESLALASISAPGRVEGTTPEVELRPQLKGPVTRLLVEEGQVVTAGEVLLRIDDAQLQYEHRGAAAEVELAEAQLKRLENGARAEDRAEAAALYNAKLAELERAQLNWRRTQQLLQQKSISQREADNHRTLVKSARAELAAARARYQQLAAKARPDEIRIAQARIAAAKARLEQCRVQLDRTQLKAPTRGQVLKLNVELGELVGPDSPEPALVMADTSCFCVRAFIEELDAPRVEMGRAVKIVADGLPDQTFTGRVTRVSPRMSSKTVWSDEPDERRDTKVREVCIDFDDPVSLVVGLRVDVYIEMKSAQNGEDLASIPVVTGAVAAVQEKPPQMVSR